MRYNISTKNVVIVAPALFSRVAEKIELFLKSRVCSLLYIGILPILNTLYYHSRLYKKGRLVQEYRIGPIKFINGIASFKTALAQMLLYGINALYVVLSVLRYKLKFDFYIGVGPFCALLGLILRSLNIVRRVIYYQLDYFPTSWADTLIHEIRVKVYAIIDRIVNTYSDMVWNVSPRLIEIKRMVGIIRRKSPPQIVIRDGIDSAKVRRAALRAVKKHSIGFIGILRRDQGVQLLIKVLPRIVRIFPDIEVHIIGSGPFESTLKHLVSNLGLENHVIFHGRVDDEEKVFNILSRCACGIALFTPDSYARYGEPGKIKTYLECGLPIITTKVPYIALEIEKYRAGIVINYNENNLFEALIRILHDDEMRKIYRRNALKLASNFYWEKILNQILTILMEMDEHVRFR